MSDRKDTPFRRGCSDRKLTKKPKTKTPKCITSTLSNVVETCCHGLGIFVRVSNEPWGPVQGERSCDIKGGEKIPVIAQEPALELIVDDGEQKRTLVVFDRETDTNYKINRLRNRSWHGTQGKCSWIQRPRGTSRSEALRSRMSEDLSLFEVYLDSVFRERKLHEDRERKLHVTNLTEVWYGKLKGTQRVLIEIDRPGSGFDNLLLAQAELMVPLKHDTITRLLAVCIDDSRGLHVITEYPGLGSLHTYMSTDRARYISLQEQTDIASQIADGMMYLHSMKIVHRGLKSDQVYVGPSNKVKIGGFSLAFDLNKQPLADVPLPIRWTAPEGILAGCWGEKSDVWSFGVLLYEFITRGGLPYPDLKDEEILHEVNAGNKMKKPDACPEPFYETMTHCWKDNPEERPTFEFLQHFFVCYHISSEVPYQNLTLKVATEEDES